MSADRRARQLAPNVVQRRMHWMGARHPPPVASGQRHLRHRLAVVVGRAAREHWVVLPKRHSQVTNGRLDPAVVAPPHQSHPVKVDARQRHLLLLVAHCSLRPAKCRMGLRLAVVRTLGRRPVLAEWATKVHAVYRQRHLPRRRFGRKLAAIRRVSRHDSAWLCPISTGAQLKCNKHFRGH